MKFNKISLIFSCVLLVMTYISAKAQVKITDGSNLTVNANSILELESLNKGLLIPRIAIDDLNLPAPLTAPVPEGMMVYSFGGLVTNGLYYWNGTSWMPFTSGIGTQWTTNGTNIYYNTGNVGIGTTVPVEKLDINGNIKIGDSETGTLRATKELVLQQDGDKYGPSILRLRNRDTENGAIFETTDPTYILVDFIFRNHLNQRNIRFESRTAFAKTGVPSFHIGGLSPDSPTLSIGDNYAAFNKSVRIGDYTTPLTALDVNGKITLRTGASEGALLVSDASGTGSWTKLSTVTGVPVSKSASVTLLKTETYIVASNDITLTLPVITSADDGLSININNVGRYTDLITIVNGAGSTTDGLDATYLTRWMGYNYIASGGNWIIANNVSHSSDVYEVSFSSSWQTIPEILEFLALHMTEPSLIKLDGDNYFLTSTQIINLPYQVTFEGLSSGITTISATSGFTGGLFSCASACSFKMITFTSAFGTISGHDAVRLTGSYPVHYAIKDCSFTGFNKGIMINGNSNTWFFENTFVNVVNSALEMAAGASSGSVLSASTQVFINCGIAVNLVSGINSTLSIQNCHLFCFSPSQIGMNYIPATFSISAMGISNNSWNFVGTMMAGFDFSRSDGRDANIFVENNPGLNGNKPHAKINVINNNTTTTCISNSSWYKAKWTNTSVITTKFAINDNKIVYLPKTRRDLILYISGNVMVANNNRVITIGIAKNGSIATLYGETTLRITVANQPFQFSTVIYLEDATLNDYFELFCSSLNSGDVLTFQDIHWYTDSE